MRTKDILTTLAKRPNALFMVKSIRSATLAHPAVLVHKNDRFYAHRIQSDGALGASFKVPTRDIISVIDHNNEGQ